MFKLIKKLIKWSLISVAGLTALAVVLALTTEPMTPERLAQREADNQAQLERAAEREAAEREAQTERERVAAAQAAETRRKGFHCLSSWNGSHRGVKNYIVDRLRDPDSFEHVETRITPVNANGEHTLIMQYRARNGFGGMNVEYVTARVDNETCRATIVAN